MSRGANGGLVMYSMHESSTDVEVGDEEEEEEEEQFLHCYRIEQSLPCRVGGARGLTQGLHH